MKLFGTLGIHGHINLYYIKQGDDTSVINYKLKHC